MLTFVASNGSYREREAAIQILGLFREPDATLALKAALSDKVKCVAYAAIEALTDGGGDPALQAEIESTIAYWTERELRQQQNWNKFDGSQSLEKLIDKSKMVRFDAFKRKVIKQMNKGQFY